MAITLLQPLRRTALALATTMLGGCYYGDLGTASSYAAYDGYCAERDEDAYYGDPGYGYDGTGYGCYDPRDYSTGFVQIGFGGGWYQDYYYPGYGLFVFDRAGARHAMRRDHRDYWGSRRAWWRQHRGERDWQRGEPGHAPGYAPGYDRGDRPGRYGDYRSMNTGTAPDYRNTRRPERQNPRRGQDGRRPPTGYPAPVVVPGIEEAPVPTRAPQVTPQREYGQRGPGGGWSPAAARPAYSAPAPAYSAPAPAYSAPPPAPARQQGSSAAPEGRQNPAVREE